MSIYKIMEDFANWAWGGPVLIWLLGGGLMLTIAIGGIQVTKLIWIIKNTIFNKQTKTEDSNGISSYSAVLAALSSTIGTGNIIGVAIAIIKGGPGAIFWMWVVGFIAMAIKYSEVVASMKFRQKRLDSDGYDAGPYIYLKHAFKFKSFGKLASFLYAICLFILLLIGAGVHTGSLADNLEQIDINRWIAIFTAIGIILAVVFGGLHALVKITDKLVPIMTLIFILGSICILAMNYDNIIPSLILIVKSAFTPAAASGGFLGATIAAAIRWGCARGMYSSDSGNGITSIIHGQSNAKHPVEQGIWGIFEVFVDTIIICSITAIVILSSGVWTGVNQDPATLSTRTFEEMLGLPGKIIIIVTIVLFALSTLLSFAYFIGSQAKALTGSNIFAKIMQFVFLGVMLLGGIHGVNKAMIVADVGNAIAIFINMTGLILLIGMIRKETKDYFKDKK